MDTDCGNEGAISAIERLDEGNAENTTWAKFARSIKKAAREKKAEDAKKKGSLATTTLKDGSFAMNPWTYALVVARARRLRKMKTWIVPCEAIDVQLEGSSELTSISKLSRHLGLSKEIIGNRLGVTVATIAYEARDDGEREQVTSDSQWVKIIESKAKDMAADPKAKEALLTLHKHITAPSSELLSHYIAQVWAFAVSPFNHDAIAHIFLEDLIASSLRVHLEDGEASNSSLGVLAALALSPRMVPRLGEVGVFDALRDLLEDYKAGRTGPEFKLSSVASVVGSLANHNLGMYLVYSEGFSAVKDLCAADTSSSEILFAAVYRCVPNLLHSSSPCSLTGIGFLCFPQVHVESPVRDLQFAERGRWLCLAYSRAFRFRFGAYHSRMRSGHALLSSVTNY